jgi:hypothetical protein
MPTRLLAAFFVACLITNVPLSSANTAENAADRPALHLLNRLAFDPTLEDLQHIETIGVDRYIEEQIPKAGMWTRQHRLLNSQRSYR